VHAITLKYAFLTGFALLFHPHIKRVFTIAGLGYFFSGEGIKPKLLRLLISPALKFVLKGALIIVQNPDDRDLLIKRHFIKSAHLIRGSGVDTTQYLPRPDKEQSPPIVLMPTRLVRDKGVIVFSEAARLLKSRGVNARFQIAGGMEGANPNTITKAEMDALIADGAVEWLGRVNEMPALYATASLIAYPSWYREGVPKVLLEAASSGKAIVTTDHPGCREVVTEGVNGYLVPVKNAQALGSAIEKILKDKALRQSMGAAGRQKALAEFDVNLVVAETLKVYSKTNS
jgi:glycosyltransferase involved in cell wall biosynthesis